MRSQSRSLKPEQNSDTIINCCPAKFNCHCVLASVLPLQRAPVQRHKNKGHRHQQGDAADNGGRKSPKLRKNRSGGNVPAPPPPPPEGDPSSPLSSIFSGVKLRKRDPTASVSSAASIGSGTNVLSQVHLRKVTDDATSEKSICKPILQCIHVPTQGTSYSTPFG